GRANHLRGPADRFGWRASRSIRPPTAPLTIRVALPGHGGFSPTTPPVGSAVHRAHVLIALPAGRAFRCRLVDPLQVLARQGDPERGHVLLQVLAALGARDGNDALPLGQEPRQGQLGRRHLLRGGDLPYPVHELQVLLEILSLKPRPMATPVVLWQILE